VAKQKYTRRHQRGRVYHKGRKLYVQFQYLGQRIEEATRDFDTPENRDKWEIWLDRQIDKILDGEFEYAKAFPGAKPEKLALFSRLERKTVTVAPLNMKMGAVIESYRDEVVPNFTSKHLRTSFESKIRTRILPYFEDMPLGKFNSKEVAKFIGLLAGRTSNKERK
jgi:hypothetical protein